MSPRIFGGLSFSTDDVVVVLAISGILVSSYPLFVIKKCQKFDSSFAITEAWETHL